MGRPFTSNNALISPSNFPSSSKQPAGPYLVPPDVLQMWSHFTNTSTLPNSCGEWRRAGSSLESVRTGAEPAGPGEAAVDETSLV